MRTPAIILDVDTTFLILIVIPLALYLLVMLGSVLNITEPAPAEAATEPTILRSPVAVELDAHPDSPAPALALARAESEVTRAPDVVEDVTAVPSAAPDAPPVTVEALPIALVESMGTAAVEPGLTSVEPPAIMATSPDNTVTLTDVTEIAPAASAEMSAQSVEPPALTPESEPPSAADQVTAETADASDLAPEAAPSPALTVDSTAAEPDAEPAAHERLKLPDKASPKYAFDYKGRLWVEKKNRGFFRQLRRPNLPPDEPQ